MKLTALGLALGLSTSAHAYTVTLGAPPTTPDYLSAYVGDTGSFSTSIGTFFGDGTVYAANTNAKNVVSTGEAFMALRGNESLTLNVPVTSFSFLWGSPNAQNVFEAGNVIIDSSSIGTNPGWVTVSGFDPTQLIQWHSIGIGPCNPRGCSPPAFEFSLAPPSGGGVGAVPEPSTWLMFGIGFLALGYAAMRRPEDRIRVRVPTRR